MEFMNDLMEKVRERKRKAMRMQPDMIRSNTKNYNEE